MFFIPVFVMLGLHFMIFPLQVKQYIGLREFVFEDKTRSFDGQPRTLEVALWYPTKQQDPLESLKADTWKLKDVVKNASLESDKKFPLIIFSHGYSGNQWTNSWFAEHMAEQGYMVAIVRHYGNSSGNMIPEICARPWHRPQDMSFVLDRFLEDKALRNNIDINRIAAAGFSQGGIACMWLAGVQAHLTPENVKGQITVVNNPEYQKLHFKDISSSRLDSVLDLFTEQDFKNANKSYYDDRFKVFFVLAPGIDEKNIMFTKQGLSLVNVPIHIYVGQADEGCVEQSEFFAQCIPMCHISIIPGKVSHMTLLNEGTCEGKIRYPFYTVDDASIIRAQIHQYIAEKAVEFFENTFKAVVL